MIAVPTLSQWLAAQVQADSELARLCDGLLARTARNVSSRNITLTGDWPSTVADQRPPFAIALRVEDSLESLLAWNEIEGAILSFGGTPNTDLSAVRGCTAELSHGGKASGPVSFMRAAEAWAALHAGETGGPASLRTVNLRATHSDVWAFTEARKQFRDANEGLQRARITTPRLANFPISRMALGSGRHFLRMPRALVQRLDTDQMLLMDDGGSPDMVKVRLNDLGFTAARAAMLSGEPGWFFENDAAGADPRVCGLAGGQAAPPGTVTVFGAIDAAAYDLAMDGDALTALLSDVDDLVVLLELARRGISAHLPPEVQLDPSRREIAIVVQNVATYANDRASSASGADALTTAQALTSLVTARAFLRSTDIGELTRTRAPDSPATIRRLADHVARFDRRHCADEAVWTECRAVWDRLGATLHDGGAYHSSVTAMSSLPSGGLAHYPRTSVSDPHAQIAHLAGLSGCVSGGVEACIRLAADDAPSSLIALVKTAAASDLNSVCFYAAL